MECICPSCKDLYRVRHELSVAGCRSHAGQISLFSKDINHRDCTGKTCASEAGVSLLVGVEFTWLKKCLGSGVCRFPIQRLKRLAIVFVTNWM